MDVEVDGSVANQTIRRRVTRTEKSVEEEEGDSGGGFRDVAVDFVAGSVSGCAGMTIGHVRVEGYMCGTAVL